MTFQKIGHIKKDKVLILKRKFPLKSVGKITVYFEELNEDLDLSELNADIDLEKQKTTLYLYMKNWPSEIETPHRLVLFGLARGM